MNFVYKNAFSFRCLKELENISVEKNNDKLFMIEELSYLAKILQNDEKVITFISGLVHDNNCVMVLTDKRIILIDSTLIFTIINLDEINSIKYEIKESFGEIFIKYNSRERVIKNVSKSIIKLFVNLTIETTENYKKNYSKNNIQKNTKETYYLKLEKLAGLRNEGIISEDKFNVIKQKLINGTI